MHSGAKHYHDTCRACDEAEPGYVITMKNSGRARKYRPRHGAIAGPRSRWFDASSWLRRIAALDSWLGNRFARAAWWRGRKTDEPLPFPVNWWMILEKTVPNLLEQLPEDLRESLKLQLPTFIRRHKFTGAQGFEVTEEMKVTIAATAVQLTLRLDLRRYARLSEIIVYPETYVWPENEDPMLGEVHEWGTVVLSWEDLLGAWRSPADSINPGHHEFAHILDRADGTFDGTPPLHAPEDYPRWRKVMSRHFLALRKGRLKQLEVLDEYGAENEAEFFAISTEAFFSRPRELKKSLPDLYRLLRDFYRQDPAMEYRFSTPNDSSGW